MDDQLVSVVSIKGELGLKCRTVPFLKSCCRFHLERGGAKLQVVVGCYGNTAGGENRAGPGWRMTVRLQEV